MMLENKWNTYKFCTDSKKKECGQNLKKWPIDHLWPQGPRKAPNLLFPKLPQNKAFIVTIQMKYDFDSVSTFEHRHYLQFWGKLF